MTMLTDSRKVGDSKHSDSCLKLDNFLIGSLGKSLLFLLDNGY